VETCLVSRYLDLTALRHFDSELLTFRRHVTVLQIRQDLFVVYFASLSVSGLCGVELEGTVEGRGHGLVEAPSRNLARGTEENHENIRTAGVRASPGVLLISPSHSEGISGHRSVRNVLPSSKHQNEKLWEELIANLPLTTY
jgi:hypothetical protein